MAICKQETIFQPLSYTFPPRSSSPWTTTSTPSSETRSSSSRSSAMSWALLSALSLLRLFPFASPSCSFKRKKKKKKHSQSPVSPQAVWWEGHLSTYHSQSGKGINPSLHVYGHKMCQWRAASTSSDAEVFLSSRCHHQYNCCDRCLLTAGKWR